MAITAIPGQVWWPPWHLRTESGLSLRSVNDLVIDAADEKAAMVFRAPKAGNISKLAFKLGTVTTGATVDVRLETVDATTGNPTGTLATANSNGSLVVDAADDSDWKEVTLTASHTASLGDVLALVVVNPGASFGNMAFTSSAEDTYYFSLAFPYAQHYTGSWGDESYGMYFAVGYDDSTWPPIPGMNPLGGTGTTVSTAFNNTSTPDHRGMKFKFPVKIEIDAAWLLIDNDGDFDLKLYDSDGTTVLQTVSHDKDLRVQTQFNCAFLPIGPQELEADTFYRLVVEPTSATNVLLEELERSQLEPTFAGSNVTLTHKKDGGWTDDSSWQPSMGVKISGIESGGGGLLVHPGMSGGMRG